MIFPTRKKSEEIRLRGTFNSCLCFFGVFLDGSVLPHIWGIKIYWTDIDFKHLGPCSSLWSLPSDVPFGSLTKPVFLTAHTSSLTSDYRYKRSIPFLVTLSLLVNKWMLTCVVIILWGLSVTTFQISLYWGEQLCGSRYRSVCGDRVPWSPRFCLMTVGGLLWRAFILF